MNQRAKVPPREPDPDSTDRLPALQEPPATSASLEDTGARTAVLPHAPGSTLLQAEIGRREETIAHLSRALREKSAAILQLEGALATAREAAERQQEDTARVRALADREAGQAELAQRLEAELADERAARAAGEQELQDLRRRLGASDESRLEMEKRVSRIAAERDEARNRIQELEQANAQREQRTPGEAEAEKQQLRERVAELRNANKAAREEHEATSRERDDLKRELAARDRALAEQRAQQSQREALLSTLQEQLRSVEARRRYESDFRHRPERRDPPLAVAATVVEAPARAEPVAAVSALAVPEPRAEAAAEPEVLRRLGDVAAEVRQRDERIASLEAELRAQSEAIGAIRDGLGLVGVARPSEPAATEHAQPDRYCLARLDTAGDPIILPSKRRITIGRTPENDLQVDESFMSRTHAILKVRAGGIVVEDAGSTNGVFVNDQRVKRHGLHEGDILQLGKARFRLKRA